MQRYLIASIILALFLSTVAIAKRDPDVNAALKRVYKDATTEIIGSYQVNGVKINRVKVTNAQGESSAEVTEYGDFLSYGIPREQTGAIVQSIEQRTGGIFKEQPTNISLYRVTQYAVELRGDNGKTYEAVFDAVGRLRDLRPPHEVEREQQAAQEKVSGSEGNQARSHAGSYFPEADLKDATITRSAIGDNFFTLTTKGGGQYIVSDNGQVYAFREPMERKEVPPPVLQAIDGMFKGDRATKVYRGEWQYYQFGQQTPAGEQVVVRMRSNGDILRVNTSGEPDEPHAVPAAHKEPGSPKQKKP